MSHAGFPSPGLFLLLYFGEGLPATLSNHSTIVSCVSRAAAHEPLPANALPVNREPRQEFLVFPSIPLRDVRYGSVQTWRRCLTGEQGHVGVWRHTGSVPFRWFHRPRRPDCPSAGMKGKVRGQTHPNLQRLRRCLFLKLFLLRPLISLAISILAILKEGRSGVERSRGTYQELN